jgi:hypothetical protein
MYKANRACLGLIAATALLSACASKPNVIPAGRDHGGKNLYAIAGQADLNASASREASQYCEKHGKSAVIQDSGYRDSGFTFTCAGFDEH